MALSMAFWFWPRAPASGAGQEDLRPKSSTRCWRRSRSPDALLSQILMASTYPLEVIEAARWSKANPTLKGDATVAAVKDKGWDVSVMSMVAFPDVLAQMSEQLTWTQKLGDAMLGQQQDVADSIQRLRARASAAGNLQTTPQQTVTTQGSGDSVQYVITPTNPDVYYAPSYNPSWAYGAWPNPAYPPYYYPPGGVRDRHAVGFGHCRGGCDLRRLEVGRLRKFLRQRQRQPRRQYRQELRPQ
jgi:hypothetical protein